MKPINPSEAGLLKVDCYQKPEHPVKPEGEVWIAASPEEIQLLAKAAELVIEQASAQREILREDLIVKGIEEQKAQDQLDLLTGRIALSSRLAYQLSSLAKPETLAEYSKKAF